MMRTTLSLGTQAGFAMALILGASNAAMAQQMQMPMCQSAPAGAAAMAKIDGEVQKVDKDAKKVTIKHGPITNLNMPGMTMVFQVKDPAMLDQVKTGDKVRFKAEKANGAIVVTEIQPAGK